MRKLLLFVPVLFLCMGCQQPVKIKDHSCEVILEANENMKSLLDSFLEVNGKENPVYEIYIDKRSPQEYNIILYTGNKSLLKEQNRIEEFYPVEVVKISNVTFDIYSGLEYYFKKSANKECVDSINQKKALKENIFNEWAVKDSAGKLTVYETFGAYPFMALPNKLPDDIKLHPPQRME